jgi:RHS repeat-associated protein
LGTVRDLVQYNTTTSTTTLVNHIQYDTFGQLTSQTDPTKTPWFGYTGREWDTATGLTYYRARWYDPRAGRFISEDPLSFAAGDVNLNRYVGNGATLWVDPSGMAWGWGAAAVGAGIGAVVGGTICVGSSLIFNGSLPTQGQLGGAMVSGAISGGIVSGCASGDPSFIGAVAIGAAANAAGAMTGTVVEKIVDQQPIHVGEVLINGGVGAIGGGIGGGIGHHLAGATAGGTLTITTGTGFTLSPGGLIAVQATTATVSIREAILATSQATAMAGAAGLSNLIHMTATGGPDPAREMAEKEAASIAPNSLPPVTPPTNRGGLRQAMGQPPPGMTNPNAHHDLPWTFRDWFARRGLNVNDPRFGRWVEGTPPGEHLRWSAEFEAEWRKFKDRFPSASAKDVIAFMNRLRTDPRFQ